VLLAYGCHVVIWWLALKAGLKHLITPTDTLSASWKATVVLDEARMKYGWGVSGCVYLQVLEISWHLKLFLEILEVSWNLLDASGKFYNWQCNFRTLGSFLYTVHRQVLGFVFHKLAQWWALLGTHHHMLSYRYYKLHTCILTLYSLSSGIFLQTSPDCSPFIKL